MLAFDHGYFQGPTTGLERVDQTILPLAPYADCLMLTRGIQRSVIPASTTKAIALRASGGTSMISPMEEWEGEIDGKKAKLGRPGFEPLSNESTALNIEEAIRLNASVLAVQVFIGSAYERQSLKNLTDLVDAASRYGIAVMGVTAVGRAMARTPQYFRLATRIMAELGANVVKCYYTDTEFDTVTSCCPVPIVIAGGKKLPELDALQDVRQRHQARRERRRYGPQHLPERCSRGDDAGRARRGARRPHRRAGLREIQRPQGFRREVSHPIQGGGSS
jgi:putative autoinducer-2 (AI-2) aldolase